MRKPLLYALLIPPLLLLLLAGGAGSAPAPDPTGNRDEKAATWVGQGDHARDGREGGETIATAIPIASLPFVDNGATCDNINDYDEVCPYTGSASPDVVYSYTPDYDSAVTIDLCASAYDTKVYVYAEGEGDLVACNDDYGCGYSGYQSRIENISLEGGITYYIVIDGYGSQCGSYELRMEGFGGCVVVCPEVSQQEGEPPCVDNYYDQYNGGCNTTGWTLIEGIGEDCSVICGKSCTYLYQGASYRDTDWYLDSSVLGMIQVQCMAEFPLQLILIYGTDCNNLQYDITTAGPCQMAGLTRYIAIGAEFWVWVGPQVFSGIPVSDYVLRVYGGDGIGPPPSPVLETTWGAVKNRYR